MKAVTAGARPKHGHVVSSSNGGHRRGVSWSVSPDSEQMSQPGAELEVWTIAGLVGLLLKPLPARACRASRRRPTDQGDAAVPPDLRQAKSAEPS